jgi:nitroimidazol reductase NimA-like FMN-containing flavoprotein (pyridoxamine 5'-phosphate oxidase superfamily)
MNAEELASELNHPGAQELLRNGRLARLAYSGRDGFPRVVPIGFHWDGGRIFVCTATIAPKVKALAERPNVALTIDTDAPPVALMIRGTAETEIVDGIPAEYLAASAKSMSGEELQAFETQVRNTYKQMARIAITPDWARYYDFGAGRVPGFLHKLATG